MGSFHPWSFLRPDVVDARHQTARKDAGGGCEKGNMTVRGRLLERAQRRPRHDDIAERIEPHAENSACLFPEAGAWSISGNRRHGSFDPSSCKHGRSSVAIKSVNVMSRAASNISSAMKLGQRKGVRFHSVSLPFVSKMARQPAARPA